MLKKIVVMEPLGVDHDLVEEKLGDLEGFELEYFRDRNESPEELKKRIKGAHIVVVSNIKLDADILSEAPDLEMICVAFTGFDLIDIDYCKGKDIVVSNASGYATTGVVELIFGLILDVYRKISEGNRLIRDGGTHHSLLGIEIENKKFGVVGAGAIGKQVIRLAQAFNAEVYVYNRSDVNIEGVHQCSLEELFSECDIVSISLPLNNSTRGIITKELIDSMKKDSIFINCARGPIVDNEALADALIEKRIAGAGVDVFDTEPPLDPNYKLLSAPNTILTPHVAYYTQEAMEKRLVIVEDNVKSYISGNPINEVY